jgi:hypothetical protein
MRSRSQSIAVFFVALVASLAGLAKAEDGDNYQNANNNYQDANEYNDGNGYNGGSYTQNQAANDYIQYWTEYAILPKRCIV